MGDRTCSVEGCNRSHYGRGWCQLHYNRVRNTGSTDPRLATPVHMCEIPECKRQANVPGSARGWCGPHYQRWQRLGDPLRARQPVVGVAQCSIPMCTSLVCARGWCTKHWTRWKRYGDPAARIPGEVVDGRRICPRCGLDKSLSEWGKAYCKPCVAAKQAEHRRENPPPKVVGTPTECRHCSQSFMADKRRSTYCSSACLEGDRSRANWKNVQARRARLRAVLVEIFDRVEIFERDGWICQICQMPVDRGAKPPHPRSPSLDHIIPIARGGKHSRANAQTACLGCNVRKGVRLTA